MSFRRTSLACSAAAAVAIVASVGAQQPTVAVDDDDITIRGCIRKVDVRTSTPLMLVWGRGDLMMVGAISEFNAPNPVATTGLVGRVLYWLDDDEDLARYVGQQIELKGELEDIEKGKIEIEQDGAFTEIELELDGKEEKARVPTSWLGVPSGDRDREFEIVARHVDVENVRVLGACALP
jgi:hypothetical protein